MKRFLLVIAASVLVFFLFGCASDGETSGKEMMVEADSDEVWDYMVKNKDNFMLWPGTSEKQAGESPHGAMVTIGMNDIASKTVKAGGGEFKPGAFIVKVNYSPEGNLGAYTVMLKTKNYDPNNGNWYWAKYLADGTLDKTPAGDPIEGETVKMLAEGGKGCIACHASVEDNDWVFTAIP
jgi:hypothetical protein